MRLMSILCPLHALHVVAQVGPSVSGSTPASSFNSDTAVATPSTPTPLPISTTSSGPVDDAPNTPISITSTIGQSGTTEQTATTSSTSSSEVGLTADPGETTTPIASGLPIDSKDPIPPGGSDTFTSISNTAPGLLPTTTTSEGAEDGAANTGTETYTPSQIEESVGSTSTSIQDLTSTTASEEASAQSSTDSPDQTTAPAPTLGSTGGSDTYPPSGLTQPIPPTPTDDSTQTTCTPLASIESENAPSLGNFAQHPCPGEPKSFWRLPCRGQSGIGRIDPLMDPGGPGAHVHTIAGGNGFGLNATFESLAHSTCTSCQVKQDKSAYWTPTLNFMYDNGTTVMVEQLGGMLAYYKSFANTIPFPEGFSMITGNPYIRNFTGSFPDVPQSDISVWKDDPDEVGTVEQQFFLSQRAIGFNCLNYYGSLPPEASLYRHQLPTKEYMDYQCIDGLRLELAFPTCGNGSIDSTDHKSHMKYPSLVQQGVCPTGYDTLFPLLFYETIYNTWAFAGVNGTFLLSYGDPIGTGYHGDFMMGWESEGMLEQAIDECRNISGRVEDCSVLDLQSVEEQMACHFAVPDAVKEDDAIGPRNGLAVDVPIQYGPQQANTYLVAGQSGAPTKAFELEEAPRTYLGNLSIAPYGSLGNPTLMKAAGTGAAQYEFLTTPASTPLPIGMTPLSPLSYVSGVIAPQFSRYLTVSASNTVVSKGRKGSETASFSNAQPDQTSSTGCEAGRAPSPISIVTSYKTIGNEVVQILIEDVELVITTRTTISVTGATSTLESGHASAIPGASSYGGAASSSTGDFSQTTSTSEPAGRPEFNTVMWVLGSETFRTSSAGMGSMSGTYQSEIAPTTSPTATAPSSGAQDTMGSSSSSPYSGGATESSSSEMESPSSFAPTTSSEDQPTGTPDTNTDRTDLNTLTVSDGINLTPSESFSSSEAPNTLGTPTSNSDSTGTASPQSSEMGSEMSSPTVLATPTPPEDQTTGTLESSTASITASLTTSGSDMFITMSTERSS